ncbi:Eukaryotic translation initiation factor 2 subunit 1 [Balamuthia mandrillaris]
MESNGDPSQAVIAENGVTTPTTTTQADQDGEVSAVAKLRNECRMYEAEYPSVDELVMVLVVSLDKQVGATVVLLEYGNKEGIILLKELSARRIRSIKNHIRVGKQEVMQVLTVDKDKGYIDLTKKNLLENEVEEAVRRFNKSKTVHSIMAQLAETHHKDLLELNKCIAWPLYRLHEHAFDAFKKSLTDPTVFDELNLEEELKQSLLKTIEHRMGSQPVKIQAEVSVTCYGYAGIDAIIPALKSGQQCGTEASPIKVHLVCSPDYSLVTADTDHERGIGTLNKAIEAIQAEIRKHGGDCVVKKEARVVDLVK